MLKLLNSTRAASLTEYAVLTGILSVAIIGAVLAFAGETTQGPNAAREALAGIATPTASGGAPAPGGSGNPSTGGGSGTPAPGGETPPAPSSGVLDTFGFVLVYDEAFPDRSSVSFHIATTDEPFNPFAAGVCSFVQTQSGGALESTSLFGGSPLLDDFDASGSGVFLFTPSGSSDQFRFSFEEMYTPVIGPFVDYWLPVYESQTSGMATGTPVPMDEAAAAATANLESINLCNTFQPNTGDGATGGLTQQVVYWSPVVAAPAGRHIFQVLCSKPEDAAAVSGSFVPVVGSFYPF